MAKCRLSLRFENPGVPVPAGDEIRGIVTVEADDDVTADALIVECRTRASGWGNTNVTSAGKDVIASGVRVSAGTSEEFPFAVRAPDGPLTFSGQLIQLDQLVRARADIAWTIDPKFEERYELARPARPVGSDRAPYTRIVRARRSWNRLRIGTLIVVGLALWLLPFPYSLLGAAVGLGLALLVGKNVIAARKLGDIAVALGATRVCAGEVVPVTIVIRPPEAVTIDRIVATIDCRESATRGSGSDRQTKSEELLSEETVLVDGGMLDPREPFTAETSVPIPVSDACSVSMGSNSITWKLTLRVAVPGWPDWTLSRELEVVPATPSEIGSAGVALPPR
jgi:hypothetical protein